MICAGEFLRFELTGLIGTVYRGRNSRKCARTTGFPGWRLRRDPGLVYAMPLVLIMMCIQDSAVKRDSVYLEMSALNFAAEKARANPCPAAAGQGPAHATRGHSPSWRAIARPTSAHASRRFRAWESRRFCIGIGISIRQRYGKRKSSSPRISPINSGAQRLPPRIGRVDGNHRTWATRRAARRTSSPCGARPRIPACGRSAPIDRY